MAETVSMICNIGMTLGFLGFIFIMLILVISMIKN